MKNRNSTLRAIKGSNKALNLEKTHQYKVIQLVSHLFAHKGLFLLMNFQCLVLNIKLFQHFVFDLLLCINHILPELEVLYCIYKSVRSLYLSLDTDIPHNPNEVLRNQTNPITMQKFGPHSPN